MAGLGEVSTQCAQLGLVRGAVMRVEELHILEVDDLGIWFEVDELIHMLCVQVGSRQEVGVLGV